MLAPVALVEVPLQNVENWGALVVRRQKRSWQRAGWDQQEKEKLLNAADVLLTGSSHLEASGLLGSGWRLVDIATRAGKHLCRPQTWLDYTVTIWMEAEVQRGLPLQLSASHPWKWYRR